MSDLTRSGIHQTKRRLEWLLLLAAAFALALVLTLDGCVRVPSHAPHARDSGAAPAPVCFVQTDMSYVYPGTDPLTQLRDAACAGRWVTSHIQPQPVEGPTTDDEPWFPHPGTGFCTFHCADACFAAFCAELGGRCADDGMCEGVP